MYLHITLVEMHLYLSNRRSHCCLDLNHFNCINSCQSPTIEKFKERKITSTYSRLKAAEKKLRFATHERNVRTLMGHLYCVFVRSAHLLGTKLLRFFFKPCICSKLLVPCGISGGKVVSDL